MDVPCAGKVTPYADKEPYSNFGMVTCKLSSHNPEEYIPANNDREGARQ